MKTTVVAAGFMLLVVAARAGESNNKRNTEHNIVSTELPATLQTSIKTSYSGYWITALSEEGKEKHTKYSMTLENADQVLQLKADRDGGWELVSTTPKED